MTTLISARRFMETLAALLAPFALVFACGCGGESSAYPADMRYPGRTDPLVVGTLSAPSRLDRPGEIFQLLNNIQDEADRKLILDPAQIDARQRADLESLLERIFGTPTAPKVDASGVEGIEPETLQALAQARQQLILDDSTLARGSSLFRLHCLHCHGLTGNGRGPTAPWVNPHPRDYRQGIFKFTSSSQADKERKPRRADLFRTIQQGIEGTTMPSFGLLGREQIDALVSYVIHLSLRGNLEFNVMRDLLSPELNAEFMDRANANLEALAHWWVEAESHQIRPDAPYPPAEQRRESARRGWNLFRESGAAGCIGCHKDYGRQGAYFYDAWGTIGRPADLTTGVYRGGRRPIDLFWRIYSGVNGSNMPTFGKSASNPNGLTAAQIWDLVNFVEILPYAGMRKEYGIEID